MTQALAEAGNAELSPESAEPQEQPQDQEIITPDAETEVPEGATDSQGEEKATDSAPPDPLATLDDTSLLGHERIAAILRDREARAKESARQESEAATSKRIKEQVSNYVAQGGLVRELNELAAEVVNRTRGKFEAGEPVDSAELAVNHQRLQNTANALFQYVHGIVGQQWEAEMESLSPLAKLPQEQREKVDSAALGLQAGRKTMADYLQARLDAAIEAQIAEREPALKKKWAAEAAKASSKESAINSQRAADAVRAGSPSPSQGRGDSGAARSLDDILGDQSKSLADKKAAFKASTGIDFDTL